MGRIITPDTQITTPDTGKEKKKNHTAEAAGKIKFILYAIVAIPMFEKTNPSEVFPFYLNIIRKLDEKLPSFYGKGYTQDKLNAAEEILKTEDDLSLPDDETKLNDVFDKRTAVAIEMLGAILNDSDITIENTILERFTKLCLSNDQERIKEIDDLLETELKNDPRYKCYKKVEEATGKDPFTIPVIAQMKNRFFLDSASEKPEETAATIVLSHRLFSPLLNDQKEKDDTKIQVVSAGATIARTTIEPEINPNTGKPGIHIQRKIEKIR